MCSYDSLFEIFEQITQHILFLGPSPRKRMQFLAAVESSKRELTEIPYYSVRRKFGRYNWSRRYRRKSYTISKTSFYFCELISLAIRLG